MAAATELVVMTTAERGAAPSRAESLMLDTTGMVDTGQECMLVKPMAAAGAEEGMARSDTYPATDGRRTPPNEV